MLFGGLGELQVLAAVLADAAGAGFGLAAAPVAAVEARGFMGEGTPGDLGLVSTHVEMHSL